MLQICSIYHSAGCKRQRTVRLSSRWSGACLARCGGLLNSYWCERLAVLLLHTEWKHQAYWAARSERVYCANASRMSNRKSSFITKFAHAHYYIITGIISWSVDSRHITYISKGVCFRSSVSVGTGLFPDAVDGACLFFLCWPCIVRREVGRTTSLVVVQALLVDLKYLRVSCLCVLPFCFLREPSALGV